MKQLLVRLFACLLLVAPLVVHAADGTPPATAFGARSANSGDLEQDLARIRDYLDGIASLESRFIQSNPDGSFFEGMLWLERPGRLRVSYDPPVPVLLVADGNFLIFVDEELKEVTHLPLSATPAYFLLRERIDFTDGLRVTGVARVAGTIHLDLVLTDSPEAGQISLVLSEDPLAIRQWTVLDAQGQQTKITLLGPSLGQPQDPALFRFINPWKNRDSGGN